MSGKRVGYIRVSTVDQNPERQLEGVEVDKKFIEYASGTTTKRPQLQAMLGYVREDDLIVVHSMDRLARNTKDLRSLIDTLCERKISVEFKKENLIFTGDDSPMSHLLLMIIGAVAEFEHSIIRERQLEGIALAKRAGKYKGAPKKLTAEKINKLKELLHTRKTKVNIAKELGVSRFTLYKCLKELNLPLRVL
jgi:DNA invertase Pin-like site-specific DNA recombinase